MKIADETAVKLSLDKQVNQSEGEARMVLPGIQALFGFQLVGVFNQRFTILNQGEQIIYLIAFAFIVFSTLLMLTPAAYHRHVEPECATKKLVDLATRLFSWGFFGLLMTVSLDSYLICRLITQGILMSAVFAFIIFSAGLWAWFIFPCAQREALLSAKD